MTDYIVFQKNGSDQWSQIAKDPVSAVSAKAAISAMVKTRLVTEKAGEFVAVPARSWQPMKVAVETAFKFS
jgi:hypothetical protein